MISIKLQEKALEQDTQAPMKNDARLELGIPLEAIHSLVWLSETRILVLVRESSVLRVQELVSDRQGLRMIVDAIRAHRADLPVLHYGESAAS